MILFMVFLTMFLLPTFIGVLILTNGLNDDILIEKFKYAIFINVFSFMLGGIYALAYTIKRGSVESIKVLKIENGFTTNK